MSAYYKTLRLRTGELIACGLETDLKLEDLHNQKYVDLIDPVVYSSFKFIDPNTDQIVDTVSMAPFNSVTNDHQIKIRADQIISISSIRDAARERYQKFINQIDVYNRAGDTLLNEQQQEQTDPLSDLLYHLPVDGGLH